VEFDPATENQVQNILNEVRREVAVIAAPEFNRFQHGFSHIFGGGYAAGYYSYKWAEVLDADAFSLFKEKGLFNKEVAQSFREHILEKGGTEHPMTLYKRFRGQEPTVDALLERSGMK
jgi:oligopeptidase A